MISFWGLLLIYCAGRQLDTTVLFMCLGGIVMMSPCFSSCLRNESIVSHIRRMCAPSCHPLRGSMTTCLT